MNKLYFLFGILLMINLNLRAQIYLKGQTDINIGLGIGSTLGSGSLGFKTTIPPFSGSINYGIKDNISIGAYLGLSGATEDLSFDNFNFQFKYTYIIVGARGAYFFDVNNEKIEPYGGVLLGYNIVSAKFVGNVSIPGGFEASGSTVAWSLFGGARYKVSEKLKIYGELGYGISWLQLGIVLPMGNKN